MMRVTTNLQIDLLKQSVQSLQGDLLKAQKAIASGKRVTKPSDDPTASREITSIQTFLDISSRRLQSISEGRTRLQLSESAISTANGILQRARELALTARNDTTTPGDRQVIAEEAHQLLLGFADAANTRIDGRYLFSGFETQTVPYTLNAVTATADPPVITAHSENTGSTTATVSIQTAASLTGHEYSIEFSDPTTFDVINKTTGATVLSSQAYASGGNIDFDGLRVVLTSNPSGPLTGDKFTIAPHNASDATVSASISSATSVQPHIYEIRFTSATAFDLVDITTDEVLSTGNAYASGANIVFAGITAVVTDGTVSPQAGDVFRVRTDFGYQGDSGDMAIEVGDSQTVTINLSGNEAFSGANVDVFDTLQDLNEAVLTNNVNLLDTVITNLDTGINQLTDAVADIGARTARLETIQDSIDLVSLNTRTRKSTLEDTDLAQAGTELARLETSLNATLLVLERQFQLSLLRFLS